MDEVKFDKSKLIKYIIWTFAIAWIMQGAVAVLVHYADNDPSLKMVAEGLIALVMFAPLLGTAIAKRSLRGVGWKPVLKGNIKNILTAWFAPAVLTAIGAVIFFIIFPEYFDLSGKFLANNGQEEVLNALEKGGLTYPMYILIQAVSCITYYPIINMFFAVGEEVGWRGFLYPQLKARFGKAKGWLLGGTIWGIWHWPLIGLIGYEYGKDYIGFPVVGMLLFCLFTMAVGIICDRLYEKSKCIWMPAVFHGAINAAATIPMAVSLVSSGNIMLLGPAPIGILAGLPFLFFAGILFYRAVKGTDSI